MSHRADLGGVALSWGNIWRGFSGNYVGQTQVVDFFGVIRDGFLNRDRDMRFGGSDLSDQQSA
jgi:hypothetical protein